ncbi:MAG TPA: radical SAM protein [Candidatus Poseidoniales archaeon]|nr:MAG TPA: radical SAM protein [Candidatus Poseidoniales archaeon]HII58035.1 radical SAM protein [Candidatus Poseidoniaceae archaeon]|tara:strand:+ start:1231 stop:3006 length:1776 start_codon:yes stop_codon:yes gene_type:complete
MVEHQSPKWLVLDGYEDEPAAFGVPPYVGFHIRYLCGVLEQHKVEYEYMTIDQWRELVRGKGQSGIEEMMASLDGFACIAGAVVPGKYLRGTPISVREMKELVRALPGEIPAILGGWAIRGWRHQGWNPLRKNLFLAVRDTDATLDNYLNNGTWKHMRRDAEQWTKWAHLGAQSKAVRFHPDLGGENNPGPLTYEVEVYQGCVRYKRGCKFCIEPKKGVPVWRTPEDIIQEVKLAHDLGVKHVRLGGMTDTYTYMAEGVKELEYPVPNPEPIAKLLHGLRDDERLEILHTDNGNPSIIAENLEPSEAITKTLVETLSDGAVLSFGLESADTAVHEANWLNCDPNQLKTAIRLINKYGAERGSRGLPKLLPGLNFIAGLNGETKQTYHKNFALLQELRSEKLLLRRINIRQVEGEGFQEIPQQEFNDFKQQVRNEIDKPLLEQLFPLGQILRSVRWESHGGRTRLPAHLGSEHTDQSCHGKAGITFGRQIGAYPILIGTEYLIPLESSSDILVTGHGARSITGMEIGLNHDNITEKQLSAIPGIGSKTAWKLISQRAKLKRKGSEKSFDNSKAWFETAGVDWQDEFKVYFTK